jgi:Asp-tRNA(Asn)/Glu-tRNA(Gln) amidotransferase A subunit family amidase
VQAASAADDAVAQDRGLGPLHGLPVTIKDAPPAERLVTGSSPFVQ